VRTLAPLLCVFYAACASTSDSTPVASARPPSVYASGGSTVDVFIPTERAVVSDAIRATPEAAWAGLQLAYEHFGIEVKERSDANRMLGNPRFVVSRRLGDTPLSRYLECGSGLMGAFADRYRVEMSIRSVVLSGEAGGSRIDTVIQVSARNPEGTSNTAVACTSTQRLEREIAEQVRLHAEGR